jgi:hypothetical protein
MHTNAPRVAIHLTSAICHMSSASHERADGKGPIAFRCEAFLASASMRPLLPSVILGPHRWLVLPESAVMAAISEWASPGAVRVPKDHPDARRILVSIEVK